MEQVNIKLTANTESVIAKVSCDNEIIVVKISSDLIAINLKPVIIYEGFVDGVFSFTGSEKPITGITTLSSVIQCEDFINTRIVFVRGETNMSMIPRADGTWYGEKAVGSDTINLSKSLQTGEYIKIQAIPL